MKNDHVQLYPSSVRLTDPAEVQWARAELRNAFQLMGKKTWHNTTSAPTAQPVSLHRHEVQLLERQHFERGGVKASLKADGVRFLLLLTQWPAEKDKEVRAAALMFDRALVPYEISVWAPRHLFEGVTLLDGELVKFIGPAAAQQVDSPSMLWLAFDIMVEAGVSLANHDYDERLKRMFAVLGDDTPNITLAGSQQRRVQECGHIVVANHDRDLQFFVKPCVDILAVRHLWDNRHGAGFQNDGILFTPVREGVRFGKHKNMCLHPPPR